MRDRFAKTNAVVLNSVKFGDGHKIVNLLTERFGKTEASAFGARKTRSRFGSKLEPFTTASFLLYRKSEEALFTVREVDVIASGAAIREDLYRFILGSCMIEPVVRFVEREEADRPFYGLVVGALSVLGAIDTSKGVHLLSMFDVKFLASLGYGPDTGLCACCGRSLERGETFFADRTLGYPVCGRCKSPSALPLAEGARNFIRWASASGVEEATRVSMSKDTLRAVRSAVECLYLSAFHNKPKSWTQIDEIPSFR